MSMSFPGRTIEFEVFYGMLILTHNQMIENQYVAQNWPDWIKNCDLNDSSFAVLAVFPVHELGMAWKNMIQRCVEMFYQGF